MLWMVKLVDTQYALNLEDTRLGQISVTLLLVDDEIAIWLTLLILDARLAAALELLDDSREGAVIICQALRRYRR